MKKKNWFALLLTAALSLSLLTGCGGSFIFSFNETSCLLKSAMRALACCSWPVICPSWVSKVCQLLSS